MNQSDFIEDLYLFLMVNINDNNEIVLTTTNYKTDLSEHFSNFLIISNSLISKILTGRLLGFAVNTLIIQNESTFY